MSKGDGVCCGAMLVRRVARIVLAVVLSVVGPLAARATGCPGDCNGDGAVTVDEIVTGVNVALGVMGLQVCPGFDGNGDGEVTVDEIIVGINAALLGCPAGTPAVTPVATPTVAVNHPPEFGPMPLYRGYPGYPIALAVPVRDPDGDSVLCDPTGALPEGAEFIGAPGTLSWVPGEEQIGGYLIPVLCGDRWAPPIRAVMGIVIQPVSECSRPECDPAVGCVSLPVVLEEACCAGGPVRVVREPELPCPDGAGLEILEEPGWGDEALVECSEKRVVEVAPNHVRVALRLRVRCFGAGGVLRVRARLETAQRLLFDREAPVWFPAVSPAAGAVEREGDLLSAVISFVVESPPPYGDIDGAEANLEVTMRDPRGQVITRTQRLRLRLESNNEAKNKS